MSVPAGELSHRLEIDQRVETPSGTGGVVFTYVPFKKRWGRMLPGAGREFLAGEQTQSKVVGRAKVRAKSGIEPTMRILFRGIYYNVEAVSPDSKSGLEYEIVYLSNIKGVDNS